MHPGEHIEGPCIQATFDGGVTRPQFVPCQGLHCKEQECQAKGGTHGVHQLRLLPKAGGSHGQLHGPAGNQQYGTGKKQRRRQSWGSFRHPFAPGRLIKAHHHVPQDACHKDHRHYRNKDPHAKDPRNAALLRTVEGVNEVCGLDSHHAPWQRIRAAAGASVRIANATVGGAKLGNRCARRIGLHDRLRFRWIAVEHRGRVLVNIHG